MNSLLEKMLKNSTIKFADVLADSKFFNEREVIPTKVPIINVGLAGSIQGGLSAGVTMFAGPSKNYKCVDGNTSITIYYEE